MSSCKETLFLWNEFFRDPSAFWDHRSYKGNPKAPDLRHKKTGKLLWIHGFQTPPWVKIELKELNLLDSTNTHNVLPKLHVQGRIDLLNLIKACGKEKNIVKARGIHTGLLKKKEIEKDVYVFTALLRTYAQCGSVREAQEVFEQLPVQDVVAWTALIAGYAQNGRGYEALKCFNQMQDEGIFPDAATYVCVLKACGIIRSLDVGEDIDAKVRSNGLLRKDVVLGVALIDMYAKCGAIEKAQEVFELLPIRNVVSWTALIAGYVQHGFGDEALKCFEKMQDDGIYPNSVTYICVLKACALVRCLDLGECIDAEVRKKGLLIKDGVLGNTLVDMYAKCGALEKAYEVFEQLPERNVVSWTALIAGYVQHEHGDEALECFRKMRDEGIFPDAVTYVWVLKACSTVGSLEIGEKICVEVRKKGLLPNDIVLGSALVDMYAKCGSLEKAQDVLDQMTVRNVMSWNALMTGYAQIGLGDEALKCFRKMQDDGIWPDLVTYICILKVCGILGCLDIGKDIDVEVRRQGLLQKDVVLGTTLIDMYAKCGSLEKAEQVFEQLPVKNVVSWNALMVGHAQLGQANIVLDLFHKMRAKGVVPDVVTFVAILTACSHGGLLKEGEKWFDEMRDLYCLSPVLEHYTCMIDLFGRAGHFIKLEILLKSLTSSDHLPLLLAILGACCKWVNVNLGRWAFEQSLMIDENCASAYLCMEKIYMQQLARK